MAVKPQNVVPVLKDKLINLFVDYSAGLTNTGKPFFVDPDNDYDVIDVKVYHSIAYIASQAVTLSVGAGAKPDGTGASATAFVNAQSLGTAAIAAGQTSDVTQTSTKVLEAGVGLTVTCASSGSQTGEGVISIRLRPKEKVNGNATKRPGASAQSST
jgi:hypothetical protein